MRVENPTTRVFVVVIVSVVSLLTGCGIQDYVYLEPPLNVYDSGGVLHFANNSGNDPNVFLGFYILYKFYDSNDDAEEDQGRITSYYSSSPTTIFSKLISTLGYRTLFFYNSSTSTYSSFLSINQLDRDSEFSIELDLTAAMNNTSDVEIYFADGTSAGIIPSLPTTAYRNISSAYAGFLKEDLLPNDDDLEEGQYDSITGETYLQCYVIAYGFSVDSMTEIYSEPIWFSASSLPVFYATLP